MVPSAAPLLRRYLLGDLPEPEAETLERQYFGDPDLLERVWEAENELVDDYVRERLPIGERERFERHYLASPRHRDRVRAARALWAASPAPAVARRPWVPPAGLAAGLLLAAAGLVWWLRLPPPPPIVVDGPRPAPSAVPIAPPSDARTLPSPDPQASARSPLVATFTLSAILVRGGEQPRVPIPPGTDEVVLHLRGEPAGERRLTFAVRTVEGRTVASGPAEAAPFASSPPRIATVRLPASRLPPGDYILALSASGEAEPVQQYFFRVSSP